MSLKLVIIGAGPGGYSAAIRARQLGAEVLLVDRGSPGGTCLNRGCIPSKIMRRAADLIRETAAGPSFGVTASGLDFDLKVLREKQRKIVDGQVQGLTRHFKALGLNLVQGTAVIETPGVVRVNHPDGPSEYFDYDHLLIAAGSEPVALPGLPLDGQKIISSDQALWLDDLPESLLVVGGGVIGCELAQIFHDFGVRTAIVEAMDRLLPLPGLDEEISKVYMRGLKKIKLPFFTGQTLAGVEEEGDALAVTLKPFNGQGEARQLKFSRILVSVGRRPAVDGLGLAALGVTFDAKGWVEADERFKTRAPKVWAIGDCLGPSRIMLAHVATAEALCAVENIIAGQDKQVCYEKTPSAIFTAPEIGCVGLTAAQAAERFPGSRSQDFLFRQLGKAQAMGETDGLFRLVSAPDGRVLGVHILGASATSILGEAALAVSKGLSINDLAETIHAHPTLPEGLWEAALAAADRPLHG
ncbi:MAG: dihydrolipoyl dehydrogenase [Candidatus Adiutrix sp.]|jgi:dihydrolipoamide dehydrogenase|nr:dihydrolipoyl dehydrogenase [Candidatus Adiutrix sp.]